MGEEGVKLSPPPTLHLPSPCLHLSYRADDEESMFRMENNLYQDVDLRYCLCEHVQTWAGVRGSV